MPPTQIDANIGRQLEPKPTGRFHPRLFAIRYETDLREIVVWLVQSSGYHALTPITPLMVATLLAAQRSVMIVSDHGTPFWASSAILAFSNPLHPTVPVLVASRDALKTLPEIEHMLALSLGEPCSAKRFQMELSWRKLGGRPKELGVGPRDESL